MKSKILAIVLTIGIYSCISAQYVYTFDTAEISQKALAQAQKDWNDSCLFLPVHDSYEWDCRIDSITGLPYSCYGSTMPGDEQYFWEKYFTVIRLFTAKYGYHRSSLLKWRDTICNPVLAFSANHFKLITIQLRKPISIHSGKQHYTVILRDTMDSGHKIIDLYFDNDKKPSGLLLGWSETNTLMLKYDPSGSCLFFLKYSSKDKNGNVVDKFECYDGQRKCFLSRN